MNDEKNEKKPETQKKSENKRKKIENWLKRKKEKNLVNKSVRHRCPFIFGSTHIQKNWFLGVMFSYIWDYKGECIIGGSVGVSSRLAF